MILAARRIEDLQAEYDPALFNTAGEGIVVLPFGLFSADDGLAHHYKIVSNGADRVLGSKGVGVLVHSGDHVACLSSEGQEGLVGKLRDNVRPLGILNVEAHLHAPRQTHDCAGVVSEAIIDALFGAPFDNGPQDDVGSMWR